jgi:GT2 family glycosyltransferase
MEVSVLISIVTYNSEKFIETCLRGIAQQTVRGYHLLLLDNCSNDTTIQRIRQHSQDMNVTMTRLDKNVGFAAAHNINISSAIRDYSPPFILVLNPDVYLSRDYIEKVLSIFDKDQRLGSATGKLIRASIEDFRRFGLDPPKYIDYRVIDSTGLFFTPALRHWDRGIGEKDIGQFEGEEYIFGVSGAAAFYRTDMLEDIKVGGEYYDEGFFAYREDADLSWRAQIYGWKAAYVPSAVGFHVRHVLPMGRKQYPHFINMHSVKNRFLMRIKNMDFLTFIKCFPLIFIRDIQVILYVVFIERSSLIGFIYILKNIKTYLSKRKEIFKNRRVSLTYITNWFSFRSKSYPINAGFN